MKLFLKNQKVPSTILDGEATFKQHSILLNNRLRPLFENEEDMYVVEIEPKSLSWFNPDIDFDGNPLISYRVRIYLYLMILLALVVDNYLLFY